MGQNQIDALKREDTDNKMKYNSLKGLDTYCHNVGGLGRGLVKDANGSIRKKEAGIGLLVYISMNSGL